MLTLPLYGLRRMGSHLVFRQPVGLKVGSEHLGSSRHSIQVRTWNHITFTMKKAFVALRFILLYLPWAGEAFAPSTTILPPRRRRRMLVASSSPLLLQGSLRHDDFARIFGKQEAEERRLREKATEYRSMPKQQQRDVYFNAKDPDGKEEEITTAGAETTTTNATKTVCNRSRA